VHGKAESNAQELEVIAWTLMVFPYIVNHTGRKHCRGARCTDDVRASSRSDCRLPYQAEHAGWICNWNKSHKRRLLLVEQAVFFMPAILDMRGGLWKT
jgi:hypothetical protein